MKWNPKGFGCFLKGLPSICKSWYHPPCVLDWLPATLTLLRVGGMTSHHAKRESSLTISLKFQKIYPSSHNHGSEKWLYLKGNYYWRDPFFTSMFTGGRVPSLKLTASLPLKRGQPKWKPSIFRIFCFYFQGLKGVDASARSKRAAQKASVLGRFLVSAEKRRKIGCSCY